MSSRVQKGSTVFKPVIKAKPRTGSVIVEQAPADLSRTQKPPSALNGPGPQPLPESGALVTSIANNIENVSASRTTQAVVSPTVVSTPSRSAPPILAQTAAHISSLTAVQASVPISLPTSTQQPLSVPAMMTQVPIVLPSNVSRSFFSESTLPETQLPASAYVREPSFTESRPEGSNSRKAKKKGDTRRSKSSKASEPGPSGRGRSKSRESRSRGSSGAPRKRKRAPSPPFDPDADPGDEVDPTAVTMSAICVDIGQGRISSKAAEILNGHAAWKLKSREKRARMKAIMEARKYGRPEEEVDETDIPTQAKDSQPSTSDSVAASSSLAPTVVDTTGNGFDYSQNLTTSRYNVQVRIGPNGEIVIDEDSLVVDRTENHGTETFTHVVESDQTRFVNSGTYGKRFRGSRWSAEETELFYDALSQYGENYELIAYVLPGRDRKACKNKFKAEDRKNPARISYCLNNSIPVDILTLSRMTGKDFSGPVPEIRVPSRPIPAPQVEPQNPQNLTAPNDAEAATKQVKKKSRTKSRGVSDGDAIVIGDIDGFQGS